MKRCFEPVLALNFSTMNRFSKVLVILGALLVWYALIGFLIAPALIRHFGEKALRENFSPQSAIAKVGINPFSGSFRVEGLNLQDTGGAWSVAWDEAELNISGATFVKFYPVVDAIRLDGANLRFEKRPLEEGAEQVVDSESGSSGDWREMVESLNLAEIPELRIDLLEVSDGRAEFTDLTAAETYSKTIDPINFTLSDLTTVIDGDSQMRFVAKTEEGAELIWEGDFRSQPIRSAGRLSLQGLEVHDLSPYYTDFIQFDLKRAIFGLEFSYALDLSNMENLFALTSGQLRLDELNCVPSDESDRLISVDSILVDGIGFEFPAMELNIAKVAISDGETLVSKESDGQINLARLVAIPEKAEEATPTLEEPKPNPLPPLTHVIDEIVIDNYQITWKDVMESGTASLDVLIDELKILDYTSDTSKPFQFAASYRIGETGTATLDGNITSEGPIVDIGISLDELSIELLSAYGESYGRTKIDQGKFDFKGQYYFEADGRHQLTGEATLNDVDLAYEELLQAKWKRFSLGGLDLQLSPFSLSLKSVELDTPEIVYSSAGTDAAEPVEEEASIAPEADSDQSSGGTAIKIEEIAVNQGQLRFVDTSTEPSTELALESLNLNLSGFDLGGAQAAKLEIDSQFNGSSFTLGGDINLVQFRETTVIKASLSGLALPQFSAYSGQAIGRRIANGQLDLEADWVIQSSKLDAQNKIVIKQLKLGDKVESENAVSLPLDLAITLLQGPNGVMDLSLPLSGDLSDPKVSVGQIVRTAIVGLITNVVSAPFKMLSGLVGSDEDLSLVSFEPGSADLPPAMVERLNMLSEALKERPGLKLAITPQLSEEDTALMTIRKLRMELIGEDDLSDEALYLKRLTKRYQEKMEADGAPDRETDASNAAGLNKMLSQLLPEIKLSGQDIVVLASKRSSAIRDHLNVAQGIALERLMVEDPVLGAEISGVRFDLK